MALNTELWVKAIKEDFFPNDSFVLKSVDHSEYVNGATVHVPNAGSGAGVTKNRNSYPASASARTDTDLTYSIALFEADPMVSNKMKEVELSYDKRMSVIAQSKANLQKSVVEEILYNWVPASPTKIATVGTATEAAHIPSATGNRIAMTKATVLAVKKQMDMDDVPADGRYMLLDAVMYNQLLNSLTDAEAVNFSAGANLETGVVGKYMGFDFFMRSLVLKTSNAGAKKAFGTGAAATDSAAGLAWQQNCVSRAMGEVEAFENLNDATYYGDVFSFSMRAGGAAIRSDKKGVVLIYQATP